MPIYNVFQPAREAAHAASTDLLGNAGMPLDCFAACFSIDCFLWGCARIRPAYPKSDYVAPDWDPA